MQVPRRSVRGRFRAPFRDETAVLAPAAPNNMSADQIRARACVTARRLPVCRCAAVLALFLLQACSGVALSPLAKLSVAASVAGGVSHGSVMGGSTLGALRNAMAEDEIAVAAVAPKTVSPPDKPVVPAAGSAAPVNVARQSAQPQFRDGLERACYFPNARAHSLPCT